MHARLVRADGSTQAVDLPAGPATVEAIGGVIGCGTVAVVHVVRPGPHTPGVDLWIEDSILGGRTVNSAAEAIAAFLSGQHLPQDFADLVLFTGGPGRHGQIAPLTSDYDQIITTIAGQLHRGAPSQSEQTGGTPGPEVR